MARIGQVHDEMAPASRFDERPVFLGVRLLHLEADGGLAAATAPEDEECRLCSQRGQKGTRKGAVLLDCHAEWGQMSRSLTQRASLKLGAWVCRVAVLLRSKCRHERCGLVSLVIRGMLWLPEGWKPCRSLWR